METNVSLPSCSARVALTGRSILVLAAATLLVLLGARSSPDDRAAAAGFVVADEKARHLLDRLLRRRQADSHERPLRGVLQTFERQRQMGAAARADDCVDLVDDDRAHLAQKLTASLGRE